MEPDTLEATTVCEAQYVVFKLGSEKFGVVINKVKEIIVDQVTTKLPGFSEEVEGIINLRGIIVPVYNLRKKFGLSWAERLKSSRIIVVEVQDSTLGIIVDGVSEVLKIPSNIIEKPSSMAVTAVDSDYISGIAKMADDLIILLDIDNVVSQVMKRAM